MSTPHKPSAGLTQLGSGAFTPPTPVEVEANLDVELQALRAQLATMTFPVPEAKRSETPDISFEKLPHLSEATKAALETAVLQSNDRYLETFLEPNSFCPFSRSGRQRGQTVRLVHYADSHDFAPLLDQMFEIALDPTKAVVQVIMPLIDVGPEAWSRFCHSLTASLNEHVREVHMTGPHIHDVFAVAPLHPDLAYSSVNPFTLIPLFRRTPDPTIQWVRLDALEKLYDGRTGDTLYADPDDINSFVAQPRRNPLFDRIAETNMKMAQRLGISEVERLLGQVRRAAHDRYVEILLRETEHPQLATPEPVPATLRSPCPHHVARQPLFLRDGRWALADTSRLKPGAPERFLVKGVELVVIYIPAQPANVTRLEASPEQVNVLHGRCPHRNALLSEALVEDPNSETARLVCPHHGWDFQLATGKSEGVPGASVARFSSWIEDGLVWIDEKELTSWNESHVPPFAPDDEVL